MASCLTFLFVPIFLIFYSNILVMLLHISFLDNSEGVQVMSHNHICIILFFVYVFALL
jgi:hypothetical protein